MLRPIHRNATTKNSLDLKAKQQPPLKNNNFIKTRMQSQSNVLAQQKNTKINHQIINKLNLHQHSLLQTKLSISRSEEDTKMTERNQWEDEVERKPSLNTSKGNPQLQIYRQDIERYVLTREEEYMIDHGYLRKHKLLNYKMRSYLVRHIFKVSLKFSLRRTTIYLAVHNMDLYFSRKSMFRDQFEIVSVAQSCLFIAMKYEEIYPPDLSEWVDHRHKGEIIRLEADILKVLDFQIAHYTSEQFLQFYLWKQAPKGCQVDSPNDKTLLLMDLSLFDIHMRQFKPSKLAQCFNYMGKSHQVQSEKKKAEQVDREIVQNVEWMIERNKDALGWLLDNKYRHIQFSTLI